MTMWRGLVAKLCALTLFHLTIVTSGGGCLMPASANDLRNSGRDLVASYEPPNESESPHHRAHYTSRSTNGAKHSTPAEHGGKSHSHEGTRPCASLATCSVAATIAAITLPSVGSARFAELPRWSPNAMSSVAIAPEIPPPRV